MSTRRSSARKKGRNRLLDENVHKRIVEQTLLGAPVVVVAAASGIATRTFTDWMLKGHEEQDRLAADPTATPDPDKADYLALYRDVHSARSQAAIRNVGNIQRSAAGGFVTSETTRKYRDADGNLVEETSVTRAAPDWRAAAWYLERQHQSHFAKDAVQIEVHGMPAVGAGPTAAESEDAAADLASRVAANLAALAASPYPELEGNVVDVEVVTEGAT